MLQLPMENPAEAEDRNPHTFSQVVFTDTPYSYPPSIPGITCCYTLTAAFQPNPRDWVGIFKVGWSSTKDYHTFVWVEPSLDVVGQESANRQAYFKEYYLPKDEVEFYQFCYVNSTGKVRGASTPFCFRSPEEQSMEGSVDDDLLVITTQEQLEKGVQEKSNLQKKLDQIRKENKTLENDLQKEQQEAASLKEQNDQKEKEMSQLVKQMDQIKGENDNLLSTLQQQVKETGNTKEMLTQMTKQMETQQHEAAVQKGRSQSLSLDGESKQNEKYNRAVIKINQMKEEREELNRKINDQSAEISTLESQLRGTQRELLKLKDNDQLLQVDLQSNEKEKQRLSVELQKLQSLTHNMDDLKRENQELHKRLSQQETLQNCPEDDLREKCQTLATQLQEVQLQLVSKTEEAKKSVRQSEFLEKDLLEVREQSEKIIKSLDKEQRKSNKIELQLADAHAAIADIEGIVEDKEDMIMLLRHEKEGLHKENQSLNNDIDGLRRVYDEHHSVPPADLPSRQPEAPPRAASASPTDNWQPQQDTPEVHVYDTIENAYSFPPGRAEDTEQEVLVCRHCQESFPGITQHELEQHERSHRLCPYCTLICDNMEQAEFEDHVYGHEL
ncbi:calcium-binding and coiled-coil domain-containing protein 2 isoform X2 [Notothenia coriiceps]|uniref:Calcium-binding and coiled-coil domain-containing protein 2 isoform X2 n=1 Tax=Notothenia coriiceps TaxID=8208 RepID=A0A6I9N5S7_9TELE|nr:PREDICTED: calcium-binding and coiled-coil domain-containing protein 2 isoform X2 [Notothenia coriiceps]